MTAPELDNAVARRVVAFARVSVLLVMGDDAVAVGSRVAVAVMFRILRESRPHPLNAEIFCRVLIDCYNLSLDRDLLKLHIKRSQQVLDALIFSGRPEQDKRVDFGININSILALNVLRIVAAVRAVLVAIGVAVSVGAVRVLDSRRLIGQAFGVRVKRHNHRVAQSLGVTIFNRDNVALHCLDARSRDDINARLAHELKTFRPRNDFQNL